MDPKLQQELPLIPHTAPASRCSCRNRRWVWVRRFVLSLTFLAVGVYWIVPGQFSSWTRCQRTTSIMTTDKSSSVVLQTGFPSNDNLTARSVLPNQAAAVAFSPKPDVSAMGESWWDRLFHYNHVHLDNVQLAVRGTKAQLSICSSTHDTLWQNIPDSLNCVATTTAVADIEDDEEPFNVLEWHPTDVVVLRKRQLYWLVVEPVDGEVLEWVFAQPGVNQWGSAYQTKDTWQLDSEDGPVPCAIVAVVAH